MTLVRLLILCLATATLLACGGNAGAGQEYGQCESPNEHLKVMFKPKITGHPFSHSFCIVCNPQLEPEAYGEWALAMGASQAPDNTDGLLPCLYVYDPTAPETGIDTDSLERCQSLVCDGEAEYNDMVNEINGNFDLEPLLNP